MKNESLSLNSLLNKFGSKKFSNISSELTPKRKNRTFYIPYLGLEDSGYNLAFKMIALFGLTEKTETDDQVKKFRNMNFKDQSFVVYNLSHELKIASLAASIALNNPYQNVYEIGPCFGFSSLHYSHLIKEKNMDSKPINKLTAIEINKVWLERSKQIKRMTGNYTGHINYIHGDAIKHLKKTLKKDDVVFASLAEPHILSGLFEVSNILPVNYVISYSEVTDEKIMEIRGNKFEDLIDSSKYDIFPFMDNGYNSKITWLTGLKGIIATSK